MSAFRTLRYLLDAVCVVHGYDHVHWSQVTVDDVRVSDHSPLWLGQAAH